MKLGEGTKARALIANLRSGDLSGEEYITSLRTHFELTEPKVLAFLPEKKRFKRLQADAKRQLKLNGSKRPALYNIPVGIKDIFQVEGFTTRAGSKLPERLIQGEEAKSVKRLKSAGALVMGKTVSTEFAYFAPGPTMNPHNPEHTPGGSSSGSAAAVAAGLVPLALGTQTIGSVIRPAAFCGVVGFKPCWGRISTAGVIPLSPFLDHVGTFANSVWLTKQAAKVLIGNWRKGYSHKDRPIIGIPDGDYLQKADKEMLTHFWEKVEQLKQAGYEVRKRKLIDDYDELANRHTLILDAEAAKVHKEWHRFHSEKYHKRTREMIERGLAISSTTLDEQRNLALQFMQTVRSLMEIHDIDLWIAPAAQGAAPKGLDSTGSPVMNLPWTQASLPVLGLPTGMNEQGLPLGIQFIGNIGGDEALLDWGMDLEAIFRDSST